MYEAVVWLAVWLWLRGQLSQGSCDPVRVPFTLLAGTQNEALFQFHVNSISMPQRLKGTLTYVSKVTNQPTTNITV